MFKFDSKKYYNYEQLTAFLKAMVEQFPNHVTLESIGTTAEKRNIWLLSLTNKKTGSHDEKPSLWIDGNTHASEITGAQSCLYFIHKTLTEMKRNPELQFLLDHVNFYILPQVSPDGAEYYHTHNHEIRSSTKVWPQPGFHENLIPQDLDGNGEVLIMRKLDPSGAFKSSLAHKDLLVQRKPFDLPLKNQKFFKLYKEGLFQNFDGFTENQDSVFGLDFNRQFPGQFRPEGQQHGASSHTMSSVEIKSFVDAFVANHRICGHLALHTYGGLILRPPGATPEEKFDLSDLMISKMIGEEAAKVSGYTSISTAKDFKYYSRENETGTADDWSFEHRGVYSFVVEIWDVWKAAGVNVTDHVSRYFNPKEAEILKIYKWAKAKFPLKDFFQPWKKFSHPQLGEVEIGGWKTSFLFRNPPPALLQGEMQKVNAIILQFAKILPVVKIKKSRLTSVDAKTKKVELILENQGFLPTNGSQQAIKVGAVKRPTVTIKTSGNLKMLSGKKHFETDHLQGRNRFVPVHTPVNAARLKNTNEFRFEWFFQGEGQAEIIFDYQRGGLVKTKIQI